MTLPSRRLVLKYQLNYQQVKVSFRLPETMVFGSLKLFFNLLMVF